MTHTLIGICAEAKSADEARKIADDIMETRLSAEKFGFFDWYVQCGDPNARWNYPIMPVKLESAQKIIQELFEHTKSEFHGHLVKVMNGISNKSPNSLFEDEDFKFNCLSIGVDTNHNLFDTDGEQVSNTMMYDKIKEGNCYDSKDEMFLVLYDAHH